MTFPSLFISFDFQASLLVNSDTRRNSESSQVDKADNGNIIDVYRIGIING